MTYEEAIERIRKIRIAAQGTSVGVDNFRPIVYAFDIAEKAIEKQIPKKPAFVDTRFRNKGRNIADGVSIDKCYKCPNCETHIFHVWEDEVFCPYCGQALDWSDENS